MPERRTNVPGQYASSRACLTPDESQVHVWWVDLRQVHANDVALCAEILSDDEVTSVGRICDERSQSEHLVARWLARTALSKYEAVAPQTWRFRTDETGKPEIAEPAGTGLHFNLSHSDGLVVCAVARGRRVGVDVESLDRAAPARVDATRLLAGPEIRAIDDAAAAERDRMFLRLWTLKEAFLKGLGLGLSVALHSFAFSLGPNRADLVTEEATLVGEGWVFYDLDITSRHHLAVAVPRMRRRHDKIVMRQLRIDRVFA